MSKLTRATCFAALAFFSCWVSAKSSCFAANWSVSAGNSLVLDTSASGLTVNEMSGVTYVGPSPVVGRHRFWTVQDDGSDVITFDAAFDLTGNLTSVEAVSQLPLNANVILDSEGIVQVGESLFISEENGPGVREFDPITGNQIQSVAIPPLFSNQRNNRGFESLAYDEQANRLWAANEEALTIDGPAATSTVGTTVRLLELELNDGSVTADEQYAYEVEPIHGFVIRDARSGLAELVTFPDGRLIALERSAAVALPLILHRIYEIDFSGATDVSAAPFDAGLGDETYSPVDKELLWSGGIGSGDNMEGLAVGPRLPGGEWVLLGVVDNGGSGPNTIASFTAASIVPIPLDPDSADFDADGDVDGSDWLAWQRGVGVTTLAGSSHGDANHDGTVNSTDLAIWQNQHGNGSSLVDLQAIPEPSSAALASLFTVWLANRRRR